MEWETKSLFHNPWSSTCFVLVALTCGVGTELRVCWHAGCMIIYSWSTSLLPMCLISCEAVPVSQPHTVRKSAYWKSLKCGHIFTNNNRKTSKFTFNRSRDDSLAMQIRLSIWRGFSCSNAAATRHQSEHWPKKNSFNYLWTLKFIFFLLKLHICS